MKVLIIDDEERARNLLRTILTEYCEGISEIREADDLPTGVAEIRKLNPDVVFLDVEMPRYLGTQILDFFTEKEINFHIVFTTAYSEHAVTAFQMNAMDYLLKPLRPKQIKESLAKIVAYNKMTNQRPQLEELKLSLSNSEFSKIGLPVADGLLFIELNNIICIEADGMYSKVFSAKSDCQLVSKPLKYFADLMQKQEGFFRAHRSFLINIKHIKQFVRRDGNYIVMENDQLITISKEKKDAFLEIVNSL